MNYELQNRKAEAERLMAKLPELEIVFRSNGEWVDGKAKPKAWVNEDGYLMLSAEDGSGFIDYYNEASYELGLPDADDPYINPQLVKFAEDNGYYWEWDSPAAVVLMEA
jgi:hypothetical protein